MNWLNYHHLLHFWSVAREGSIRKASEISGVTSSSISVQLRQLEKALGAQLFRKEGRGLVLTKTGNKVLEYANEIFPKGLELLESVRAMKQEATRVVRWLLDFFEIIPISKAELTLAADSKMPDFEDAFTAAAAEKFGCDCILTRDMAGFVGSRLKAVSPEMYLAQLLTTE